jgi:hypothetical protein
MKADEALQKPAREKANDYFANTLYSRLDRKTDGVIIVVMQRLHDEDLVGHLLRKGGWDHLNLPAIAVQDEDIPIGNGQFHHRKKGEVLNPAFEPLSSLEETKRVMGTLGGCGCLNRISASISGASAGVRPPRGKAAS